MLRVCSLDVEWGHLVLAEGVVFKWLPVEVSRREGVGAGAVDRAVSDLAGAERLSEGSLAVRGSSDLAAAGGDGLLTLAASVQTEDRLGDIVLAAGWELEGYRRNPVVLWAHQHLSPPIGRSVRTWLDGGTLKATVEFAPTPFAQQVALLYGSGFLNGVSVGFRVLESERRSDGRHGTVYRKQELLEISAAPVPLNPEALVSRGQSDTGDRHGGVDDEEEVAEVLAGLGRLWRELAAAV